MKRTISFLLSLAMIITMLPAGAFAAELETTPVAETQAVTEAPTEQETEAAETTAAETEPVETTEAVIPEEPAAETEEAPTEAAAAETVAEEAAATVEDDFRAALENAAANGTGLTVWDEITLTRDLTVNMTGELSFADFSRLVVPSGVTLTLNCPTVINGATLVVEEGGKLISNAILSVVAPLNPATFDMNGEFTNNGQVWVNEGATVNINGTATSWYREFHVGFGGNGKTSTLNINGTMTTYGYLNIADAGAPGVLNVAGKLILEKDGNGNAYLQAGNPVNVTGTLESRAAVTIGNDAGTAVLTVAEGGNLTVSDSAMWFDIAGGGALVNNGTLTNNFYHIGNYGAFSNNGTLNNNAKIRNYGTYTNNGTVSGNAPVDGVADARNMFLEGITNAAANGENYTVWDEVILTENLTVNMTGELSFADFSRLVVPSGVTLTLNCPTVINGATLVVEEGGKLISNAILSVVAPLNPATFDMNGEFTNNGQVWVNEGATANLGGTANSTGDIFVGFGGNGRTSTLNLSGTLSTSGYLCISNSGAPGLLKVNEGAILNIQNVENVGRGYLDNTSRVEINGTLNVDGLFTTGAAKDDDGNVVGPDASAEIRGQVMGSGTSTIVAGTHGSVNVFGNLNTSGEVVVEQESALWVDSTVTMNGPVTVAGALHVDFIDDVAGTGYLMLGGTTNVTGYLAVHDGGTLNTGAASVLNIQNIENVGCGYLDNQGTVTLNGNMYLDGLFTTGAVQDDSGNVVGPDATATNNGAIEASETSLLGVGAGGTMYNNGAVTTTGALEVEGFWQGYPANQQTSEEDKTMSFEEFKAALAAGGLDLKAKVTVEDNLTVDTWLYIYEGGELIVPNGVTLTVNSAISVMGGKIAVEEGGSLVNHSHMYVENNGILEVAGTYTAEEYNYLFLQYGKGTVTGVDKNMITLRDMADSEESLRALAAMTGYRSVDIDMMDPVRLSADLTIGKGVELRLYAGMVLTVPSGVTLRIDGDLNVFDAGVVVEPGGMLVVSQQGYMQMSGAYLHAEGATLDIHPQRLHVNLGGDLELTGVDLSVVGATVSVGTYDELVAAVAYCGQYGFVEIEPYATITVEEDLTIPENSMLAMYDQGELMQLIIPDGVTVTNCTTIVVNSNCQVWIQAGGTLDNSQGGGVNDYTGTGLIVEGTLIGDTTGGGGGGGNYGGVTSFDELKAAIESGLGWIDIYGSVCVTEDLELPYQGVIMVYEGGEFIVASGVSVTGESSLEINGGMAKLESGANLSVTQIFVDGTFIVEDGAACSLPENSTVTVTGTSTVVGVPKERCSLAVYGYSEEDVREGFKHTGYNWVAVYLYEDVTLTANLTIPENTSLFADVYWYNGENHATTLTVPKGRTITNNGFLVTAEPDGCLVIEEGAKVINNASIYNRGILVNDGEIVNNGTVYIYGELQGDGTITGEGHLDYARPVNSYADLVNWLGTNPVPTYLYVWGEVTLEDDVTIPEGTQLIMEGSTLIVPDGVTLTVDGRLHSQGSSGNVIFESGSQLICNNWAAAYEGSTITFAAGSKLVNYGQVSAVSGGTLNVYGTYVRGHEDANLVCYEGGTLNGTDSSNIHYVASFVDEASLVAILDVLKTKGYGQATISIQYGCSQVEIAGDVTLPTGSYLVIANATLVLKPGAVLTNNGEIHIYSPAQLIVDSGAELIDNGKIYAEEGCIVYLGGGIAVSADAQQILGKGKANLTASITPASSAKITWTLAEGDELYATLKGSGSKAVLTAADVTGRKTVTVIASAKLENGAEVSDTAEITIVPLTKQITLLSEGEDVTGQIITCDLADADASLALTLTADIGPDDAAPALEWTSSDETIATVENGRVTLSGRLGTATVTAAATDGSKVSAKVTIVATELVQSVALREGATELVGGKGTLLKVCDALDPGKALPADAVTWTLASAADAAYVAVTPAGKVTTKAVPEKITVKLLGTVTANPKAEALEHTITIYPAVTQVDLIDGDEIYTGRTVKLSGGTSIILQAKQYPVDSMEGVTWEISDKDEKFVEVLSAEDEALVLKSTGVKGTVTVKITAADGSKKSASVKIQTGIFLEEITVTSPSIELRSGESVQLSAEVKPTNANNMSVAWALADANDKQYVSVSSSGKVTAKKGLSMSKPITVVATAKDGSGAFGSFTLQLQPADPGALVILAEDNANVTGTTVNVDLLAGGSIRLKAKYFNTDAADVTWSGKNVTFSDADAAGYVTATVSGKGTFTVTADDGSGKKATVKLKAANLSEKIRISGPDAVSSGKSVQLKATILPEGNVADKKVTWWIDPAHTQYATVSASGKLTAAKNLTEARNISVWAQAKDGNSEPEMFCVDILPMAQSVQILESGIDVTNTTYIWDLAVDEGNPAITAEVLAADASQVVVWKLSGAKVLQQNADGTFSVTGKAGTATVTATAADGSGKKASFKFTVVKSMEYIRQAQTEAVIAGGKSLKLASYITVDPQATNKKLNWFISGDTEVATLAATGVLKTKKVTDVHTITVTATAADGSGCKAEFTILVYPATTSVKLLCDGSAAPKQTTLGIGGTMTLEGISLPSAAAQGPGAYTWKLSSDKFAEIQENPDGTVTITGKAAGTVTVTCTAADGTGKKATLKIKIG